MRTTIGDGDDAGTTVGPVGDLDLRPTWQRSMRGRVSGPVNGPAGRALAIVAITCAVGARIARQGRRHNQAWEYRRDNSHIHVLYVVVDLSGGPILHFELPWNVGGMAWQLERSNATDGRLVPGKPKQRAHSLITCGRPVPRTVASSTCCTLHSQS